MNLKELLYCGPEIRNCDGKIIFKSAFYCIQLANFSSRQTQRLVVKMYIFW